MTDYNRPRSLSGRVKELEKGKHRHRDKEPWDPDDRPGAVTGVDLDFRVREKKVEIEYSAVVTWNPLAPGTCAADIDQFDVQIQFTNKNGVPIEEARKKWKHYIVNHEDDLEPDVLKVFFHDIEHPKKWWVRSRVRVIDTAQRKGLWSGWTDPQLPMRSADPEPPIPDNIQLLFDKNEKDRHEPRWRCKVKFNEIESWDVPPHIDRGKITGTLDADAAVGANQLKISGGTGGIPDPVGIRTPIALRPHADEIEIKTYTGKTGTHLTGVRNKERQDRAHPSGTNFLITSEDAQQAQNDLKAYIVQIRRCNAAGVFLTDGDGKFIQRQSRHSWKAEEDDADGKVLAIFPNVRWRHKWKARVRTEDRFNRRGPWSDWTAVGSPSDTTAPPEPNNVSVDPDNKKIHVDWDFEPDPDDTENQHPDISHYQVELHDGPAYSSGTLVKRDFYCGSTKKTFKVKKIKHTAYYARVRSVDGSGNKSSWAESNQAKNKPPQPSAPTITFDSTEKEKGAKFAALVDFTYNEAGYNEDWIDRFRVQMIITNSPSYSGNEKRRKTTVDGKGDDGEADASDPKQAVFKGVKRRKWVRARVRAVDKDNRRSSWSPWSSSYQVADTDPPPNPTNIFLDDDVKGVFVDWDIEDETYYDSGGSLVTDTDVPNRDVDHYEVEIHSNSSFTNRVKRDKHVTATQKKFKWAGWSLSATYYARVRSVSSSGLKSGWVTSTGLTTQAVVDNAAIVDNSVSKPKMQDDAISTDEIVDDGSTTGTGTWRNSPGSTRVEISSSGSLNAISMYSGGSVTSIFGYGDAIGLVAGFSSFLELDSSPNEMRYNFDEIVKTGVQRGRAGVLIAGGALTGTAPWGNDVTFAGGTKAASTPGSINFPSSIGSDNNVGGVAAQNINQRGFRIAVTPNSSGGGDVRCSREYSS